MEMISYEEFEKIMENLEWVDREVICEGNILSNSEYEEAIEISYQKGYGKLDQDEGDMRRDFLILIDEICKDQLDRKLRDMKIDVSEAYTTFCDEWYSL